MLSRRRGGRQRHRLAGDDRAGAGEGAGVVGRQIGVGIDDGDAAGPRAEHRGGDLPMRGDRAVAHLGRADGEVVACRRAAAPSAAPERCSVGGPHSSIASAMPVPSAQSSPAGLRRAAAAGQRLLDEVEALVEPVAAEVDVGGVLPDRSRSSRPGRTMFLRRIANGSMPEQPRQLVDRAFDGEGGLRGAVAAEAAARDHVGVDRVADRPSCWGSDRP